MADDSSLYLLLFFHDTQECADSSPLVHAHVGCGTSVHQTIMILMRGGSLCTTYVEKSNAPQEEVTYL